MAKEIISFGTKFNTQSLKGYKLYFLKQDIYLYLMIALPLAFYAIFLYMPMYGLSIAFKDYNMFSGFLGGEWIGFDVFKEVFKMQQFWYAVRNTLMLNLLSLIIAFPGPILLAIMLNEIRNNLAKRFLQSVVYLPYFMSWMIIGGLLTQILSENYGIVNIAIKALGLPSVPFLLDEKLWVGTFLGALVWQSSGYNAIIYLAAITGINPELFEAAAVDGCGRLRAIWHITLPSLKPTIVIMLILNIGNLMNIGFERAFALQNPVVAKYADVISTFVFRIGIENGQYSVATAVGLFQSTIAIVMLVLANFIAKKTGEEGIW
ncbi:MAG: ABC transporter permease subunit [Clostridia bacterium]|nr:ABC transporter permease subunit [Clostridia bacterium]